ncbi:MAG TPA: hypothetical protein VFS34_09285 [Thermoanaerobaculia bacterium]|nr:hypothetical protein [Thermoanaerobaculia bacterium]
MRRSLLFAAAAVLAATRPSPAQTSGVFDEARKIWFPPGAAPEAYLTRDPKHPFGADVRRALESDPKLREAVCGRLLSPEFAPTPGSLEPSAAQLRTMEDMVCLSLGYRARVAAVNAKKDEGSSDLLAAWFAEERSAAEKMSPQDRRAAEYELRNSAAELPRGNERARAGVRMIALRPSDDLGIAFLLEHGSEATYGSPGKDEIEAAAALPGEKPRYFVSDRQVRQFVSDLYRTMIEDQGPAAGPFRSGWAGYLHLSGGDLAEARRLAAAFVSDPADDNPAFETIFVAYLDRLLGKPAPLAALLAKCPFEPADPVAAALSGNYCRTVSWSLAERLIRTRGKDAAPAAAEIVREAIRAEPANWDLRLASIRTLDRLDREESAREWRALADLPATVMPVGVRLDVLDGMMLAAMDRRDFAGALAVNQRWLDTAGYAPSSLPEDGWARLAAVEKAADANAPCDDAVACILAKRIFLARALHDTGLARRTLEERLAYALEQGFPEETRVRLEEEAQTELDSGNRAAALRIVRYLWPQPKDPTMAQLLKQLRETLSPKEGPPVAMTPTPASPWDAPSPARAR